MNKSQNRMGEGIFGNHLKAFTLAEVLITLVIIGVIAAITVPTLMAQQRKLEYVTQLKKSYSTLTNGLKLAMAKDGVTLLEDTSLYASINGDGTNEDGQDAFIAELSKIFTNIKSIKGGSVEEDSLIKYKNLNGTTSNFTPSTDHRIAVYLNDGTIFYGVFYKNYSIGSSHTEREIRAAGGKLFKRMGYIFIDVNGGKKPNQAGRDLFYFLIGNDGGVFPFHGKDYSIISSLDDSSYWKTEGLCDHSKTSIINGFACAARIMDEGWQMNY